MSALAARAAGRLARLCTPLPRVRFPAATRPAPSKIAYLLLLAAVLAVGVPATALAQVTLTINPTAVDENSTVSVSVSLTGASSANAYSIRADVSGCAAITSSTKVQGTGPTLTGTITVTTARVSSDQTCDIEAVSNTGPDVQATLTIRNSFNTAPRVLELSPTPLPDGSRCRDKTNLSAPGWASTVIRTGHYRISQNLTTRTSADTGAFPGSCYVAGNTDVPIFDDADGDRLTITMSYTLPDNVVALLNTPLLHQPSAPTDIKPSGKLRHPGGVAFSGATVRAASNVNLRIDLTATDPGGNSASTHVIFRLGRTPFGSSAPSLAEVEDEKATVNAAYSLLLPAPTGGDVLVKTATGASFVTAATVGAREVLSGYKYTVSGLPAGLSFDAATRTISGTPTATGSSTVTYTAEDADGTLTAADTASRSFTLQVVSGNNAPRVLEERDPPDADGNQCKVKTSTGPWGSTLVANTLASHDPLTTRVSTDTGMFPATCRAAGNVEIPMFDDVDGDRLTIETTFMVPDNVFVLNQLVSQPSAPTDIVGGRIRKSGRVYFHGTVAAEDAFTTVRVNVKATDPEGASASTYVLFQVSQAGNGTATPSLPAVATQGVEEDSAVIVQLPAATGGDVLVKTATGAALVTPGNEGTNEVLFKYRYAVSGLPAGLTFDERTRTIRGVATTAGTSTVTYTAHDADGLVTDADKASRSFTLKVTTAAEASSATVNGTALKLTFDKDLDTTQTPAHSAFSVTATRGGTSRTIKGSTTGSVSIDATKRIVSVTLAEAVRHGETVTASYDAPTSSPLKDTDAVAVPDVTHLTATNNTPPEFSVRAEKAWVQEGQAADFVVRLSGPLSASATVNYALGGTATHGTDYTTTPAGASGTLTFSPAQTVGRISVTATEDTAVESDETVTVALSNVSANASLSPAEATDSMTISDFSATPGVPEVRTVAIVSDPGSDKTYAPGDTVRVRLTFTEPVDVGFGYGPDDPAGKPRLKIRMDPNMGVRRAVYESGSGTDRLVFAYTLKAWDMVPTGGNAAGGIAVVANSLELNCGRIHSAASGGWAVLAHRGLPRDVNHLMPVGDPDLSGDTTPPRKLDASMDYPLVAIEFDEPLDPDFAPPGSAFVVFGRREGGVLVEVRGQGTVTVADNQVVVLMSQSLGYRNQLGLYYHAGDAGGAALRDLAGNQVWGHPRGGGVSWSLRDNNPPVRAQRAQAVEGQAMAFEVALGEPAASAATVDYETEDGTAVAGEDYEAASGTLSFAQGETVKTVRVRTLPDRDAEGAETLRLRLSRPVGLVLAEGGAEAAGTIANAEPDETAPALLEASADGAALTLVFDEALDPEAAPPGSAFTVTATDARDVSRTVAGTGTAAFGEADGEVAVTLEAAVAHGETLTVAYDAPEDNALADLSGNPAADFDGVAAANATAAPDGRPSVASVALVSTPSVDADGDGSPDTYGRGETVEVTVTWNADVTWDLSAPGSKMRVRLDVGGATRGADLVTGGETGGTARSLSFRYAVHRTDRDDDGVFPAPAADGSLVVLGGGATLKGAGGRHAHRAHGAPAADAGHRVDGSRSAAPAAEPPSVTGVALTSAPRIDADGDGTAETYGRGESVEVTVSWDAEVTWDVSAPGSKMRVRLDVGGAMKGADLVTGGAASGTARSLSFRYAVHRTDRDDDGVFPTPAADGSLVVLGGGATLEDARGRDAARAHAALAPDPVHLVDGARDASALAPAVLSARLVSDPGRHGVYGRGDTIRVALGLSEAVVSTGAQK